MNYKNEPLIRQAAQLFQQAVSALAALEAAAGATTDDLARIGGQVSHTQQREKSTVAVPLTHLNPSLSLAH